MGMKLHTQDNSANPTVLVIDDSTDVHRLLKARLRNEDLELMLASTGGEGLRMAVERRPTLILLDLDMPGMDGFEVLRALKEREETQDIPVIVLSGLQGSQDKVTAFDLGAVDYITKPFDLTELRVRVRSALKMHRLVRLLAERAQVDGLTGLWNRAHFDKRWADEVAGASRHGRALTLAMFDADHFKSVNDTFGHPAGDVVLQGIARIILGNCRQTDIACRYGGEEFALIMPDTAPEDGLAVCERIREAVAAAVWARHPDRCVTVSAGLAGSAEPGNIPAPEWIDAADRGLYEAKKMARNRVVLTVLTGRGGMRLGQAG
jgi:diguanylate cyclase (GGDEF)-like protein